MQTMVRAGHARSLLPNRGSKSLLGRAFTYWRHDRHSKVHNTDLDVLDSPGSHDNKHH